MAWVSVHDNVIGGKLRELAKELGRTQEEALGILVSLWLWGLNNADKDGRLISADKEDVLEAFTVKLVSGLDVDVVAALVSTRWLDEPEPGKLYIHDWDQWQEQWYKAMERREKDAKRKAESRKTKQAEKVPASKTAEKRADTQISLFGTAEQPEEKPEPAKSSKEIRTTPEFEEFWNAYPRKEGRGEAYKKYKARRKDGYSSEELITAAIAYSERCRKLKTETQYIKHAKTFLGDNLPFLDYLPKKVEIPAEQAPQSGNPFEEWEDDS